MAKLTAAARQKLSSKSFALPGRGEGKSGKGSGSYPIPDKSHGRNALSRVSAHGTPEEKRIVRAKVHAKFPDIGKKQFGGVARTSAMRMPKAPKLIGAPPRLRPAAAPRGVPGRLSSTAGMKKGGVAGYHEGGVATCGSMKSHSGFAELGIKKG